MDDRVNTWLATSLLHGITLRDLCVIRIFLDFSILGKFFYINEAVDGGRAINFAAKSALGNSFLPRFEVDLPGFFNPDAPIHLNRNDI